MLSLSRSEREQELEEIIVQDVTAAGINGVLGINGLLGSNMANFGTPDIRKVPRGRLNTHTSKQFLTIANIEPLGLTLVYKRTYRASHSELSLHPTACTYEYANIAKFRK